MLNAIEMGDSALPHLLIAHGLFGSARNWGVIQKRLSDAFHVTAVDMRNHGSSPRFDTHGYDDMAADLAPFAKGGAVLGHSMGGKAAMTLALTRPDEVGALIVADIAPVTYSHSQLPVVDAMRRADLSGITRRSEGADRLDVEDALKPFLLQSLEVDADGARWRYNLDTLAAEMPKIMSFPDIDGRYDGPTLFLSGANSDYVQREHRDRIRALFPQARFASIPDTGHWLHAEKPREFEAAVRTFLTAVQGR